MTIAGGIAGALFARDRTGEPSVVDVSLLGVGVWAMALNVTTSMLTGELIEPAPLAASIRGLAVNPIAGNFRTSDGRWINFNMLQPGRYFADVCTDLGLEHLLEDERFTTADALMANAEYAGNAVADAIAQKPFGYWLRHLQTIEGQWAPLQDLRELVEDPQVKANGYITPITDADRTERRLVANPVQFYEKPPPTIRAPQFAEHTDEILRDSVTARTGLCNSRSTAPAPEPPAGHTPGSELGFDGANRAGAHPGGSLSYDGPAAPRSAGLGLEHLAAPMSARRLGLPDCG